VNPNGQNKANNMRLSKIYTKSGDDGETSLSDGTRVAKHDPRVASYGAVDETNAAVGLVRLHTSDLPEYDAMLGRIQDDLFDLGADLAQPGTDFESAEELRITEPQVARLEAEIDAMNADLKPLESFTLPGGEPAAAHLHLARTVARRAEREIAQLAEYEPVNPAAVQYINRVSDHFFVMSRAINAPGNREVLWRPGANR
jgi:cob(I)alamin adenosyltransferase